MAVNVPVPGQHLNPIQFLRQDLFQTDLFRPVLPNASPVLVPALLPKSGSLAFNGFRDNIFLMFDFYQSRSVTLQSGSGSYGKAEKKSREDK